MHRTALNWRRGAREEQLTGVFATAGSGGPAEIRVVLGYVKGVDRDMGIVGVWIAMTIEWGARSLLFYLLFCGDKRYRHHLID